LKDQNHPAALVNYGALLLCKHGSVAAGTYTSNLFAIFFFFISLVMSYLKAGRLPFSRKFICYF
jgi:hypothetical protein